MQRTWCYLALACSLTLPAWAQTEVWSEAPKTQRWSEAPQRPATPPPAQPSPRTNQWSNSHALPDPASTARPPAAPGGTAGRTAQWSTPTYTQRRSDEDVQRQVDAISRDAERRALAGQGGWNGGHSGSRVSDQAWRNHMDRSRAQDQFQRDQDAYYERQRQYNR
ncbi:Uncharacterized protein pbN1_36180 [Aromatoleum bremense]|uniref:hypothetical protein n=2 Tax=Aromatoleum bremense TaxID=76115 RepID=UPI001AEBF9D8|nr:hypothetical protein [Aromatoleum bremense]QTQ33603.1 Uncharacterized protein pbN1_36180 [Aromatoleum bremense]